MPPERRPAGSRDTSGRECRSCSTATRLLLGRLLVAVTFTAVALKPIPAPAADLKRPTSVKMKTTPEYLADPEITFADGYPWAFATETVATYPTGLETVHIPVVRTVSLGDAWEFWRDALPNAGAGPRGSGGPSWSVRRSSSSRDQDWERFPPNKGLIENPAMQKGIGWRKALRSALADNPFVKGEGMSPRARRELLGHSQLSLYL